MLIPLNKGQIQQRVVSQQKKIQILQKVYELDFSVIEITKIYPNLKIYIVSIMGKQWSGKSYLLNRIFGTRFGVSSARCTDGNWISFSIVDNILFFLLDCEGLFGSRRTDDEETMLLTFITSISDATILNQDLSFDRHLNKQLSKLTNLTQQIKGQNLFQGQLFIAVRDVNQQEQGGAKKELLANIQQIKNSQKTSNFISKLFTDRFQLLFMSHFQAQPFEGDIITFRQKLLKNANESTNNWKDSSQLLKVIKIMLVQLELQDYRSLDEIEEEDTINNLHQKTIELWYNYKDDQKIILNFQNKNETYQKLFKHHNQGNPSSIQYHQFLQQIEVKTKLYLQNRAKAIKSEIQQLIIQIKDVQYQEGKSKEIDVLLQNIVDKYQMCKQQCEKCFLQCSLRKNHEKKIIQQKQQLEEVIKQNTQELKELTNQFNECESIQFDSHQQLMKEQEVIKNQIKYQENVQNIEEIIKMIQRITQFDIVSYPYDDPQSWETQNTLNIQRWVNANVIKYHLPFENQDVQRMMENYDIEIIDIKILSFIKVREQNQKQLQDLIEKIDKDKILTSHQQNLRIEIQNLEAKDQLLQLEIQKRMNQLEELNEEMRVDKELLKDIEIDNLEQLKVCQNSYKQKKSQLEYTIDQIRNQRQAQRLLIIQKLEEEQIQNYLTDLIESIGFTIQKIQLEVAFKQNQLKKKNLLLQTLENKQDSKIQSNSYAIQKEIQNLNSEIDAHNKNIEQQQQFIDELNIFLIVDFLNNEEFSELVIKIVCFDMDNEIQLKKQQLDALTVDMFYIHLYINFSYIEKFENHARIWIDYQNLNDRINSIQSKISEDMQCREQIAASRKKKIQSIEQNDATNDKNLEQWEFEYNKQQDVLLNIESQINNLKVFRSAAVELFGLVQLMHQRINNLEKQHHPQFNKEVLIQKLNQNELQIRQFFKIKEIVDKITDCNNQIAYSEQNLTQLDQQEQSNHDCGRVSHKCDQICQGCFNSIQSCKYESGHDQIHLCSNQNHMCLNNCEYCHVQCQSPIGHNQQQPHHCGNQHACPQKCKFCHQSCDIDLSHKHDIHKCKLYNCIEKCYFNNKNFKVKCQNQCSSSHTQVHDNHLCDKEHQCPYPCDRLGICFIGSYTEELKKWALENGSFEYINFIQNAERQQCQITIKQNEKLHLGYHHNCQLTHSCDHQCPECRAYCSQEYGHPGKHHINKHRNKDQQYFTQLQNENRERISISINYGQQTRQYQIGDSSTPETCQKSCERRYVRLGASSRKQTKK